MMMCYMYQMLLLMVGSLLLSGLLCCPPSGPNGSERCISCTHNAFRAKTTPNKRLLKHAWQRCVYIASRSALPSRRLYIYIWGIGLACVCHYNSGGMLLCANCDNCNFLLGQHKIAIYNKHLPIVPCRNIYGRRLVRSLKNIYTRSAYACIMHTFLLYVNIFGEHGVYMAVYSHFYMQYSQLVPYGLLTVPVSVFSMLHFALHIHGGPFNLFLLMMILWGDLIEVTAQLSIAYYSLDLI